MKAVPENGKRRAAPMLELAGPGLVLGFVRAWGKGRNGPRQGNAIGLSLFVHNVMEHRTKGAILR